MHVPGRGAPCAREMCYIRPRALPLAAMTYRRLARHLGTTLVTRLSPAGPLPTACSSPTSSLLPVREGHHVEKRVVLRAHSLWAGRTHARGLSSLAATRAVSSDFSALREPGTRARRTVKGPARRRRVPPTATRRRSLRHRRVRTMLIAYLWADQPSLFLSRSHSVPSCVFDLAAVIFG